jgi:hypothetical protein
LTHTIDTCFTKKGEFVTRSIAGEAILVPVRGRADDLDAVYNCNEVGTFIWNTIDGQTSMRTMVNAVCEAFEVSRDDAEKDVAKFVAALVDFGILQTGQEA